MADAEDGSGQLHTAFKVELRWVVAAVYPPSVILFWLLYFKGWAPITRKLFASRKATMDRWSSLQHACFYANANSCLHTGVVVVLLVGMLASDDELWRERLHPHSNDIGHAAMSFSLAYFTFAIPWQWRLYFCKGERAAVNLPMVLHHLIVLLGILIYILSSICAPYGAVAFACMEFTNWFFVPYTMMSQLDAEESPAYTVVGVCLVLSFVACRIVICTWQGIQFTIDLSDFESDNSGEWTFVILAYAVYLGALTLSWIWLRRVLTECRDGVKELAAQMQQSRASVSPANQPRSSWSSAKPVQGAPPQRTSMEPPSPQPV